MGPGVALFDYDNDGRLDIFVVNGAPLTDPMAKGAIPQKTGPKYWNRLYHQKSDGTFEDVTEKAGLQGAGYGMGVAVGDYDNDGFEDLFVTAYGGNKLYHNNGDGTFTDVTQKAITKTPPAPILLKRAANIAKVTARIATRIISNQLRRSFIITTAMDTLLK